MSSKEQKEIAEMLIDEYEKRAKCVVKEGTDIYIRLNVMASALTDIYEKIDFYDRQIYPNTAQGEYLIKHGQVKGITKKQSTKAKGYVVFLTKEPAENDILISKGTLCTSSKSPNALYQTISEAKILKGSNYVSVEVESVKSGSDTNIAPEYVDILVSPISGVSSIKNPYKISGGADEEPDELFRQRVIESYSKITNGANLNYYEQWAKSKADVWHAKAIYDSKQSNHVIIYVENATRTISDSTISMLQEEVETKRELGMKVTILKPEQKLIDVAVVIYIDNLKNQNIYKTETEETIISYFQSLSVGQRFSTSGLASKILQSEGINDIVFVNPKDQIEILENQIPCFKTLNIEVKRG